MTPEELAKKMQKIIDTIIDDEELAHIEADDILCEVLRGLGYGEGVDVYERVAKWYA